MSSNFEIKKYSPSDLSPLENLYQQAFPEEDLVPLVKSLSAEATSVISLVALKDENLVGNIILTRCKVGDCDKVALLGPLAVAPNQQKSGIGSALIQKGLENLREQGFKRVQVLGDPKFYSRFGFKPDQSAIPPYELPKEWSEAWQFISLDKMSEDLKGNLEVPTPWQSPSLWQE